MQHVLTHLRREVAKVIIGQSDVVDRALVTIFAGRHALIEGVPGVAKTLLVRTLAHLLGCTFHRIQFTSDLMPADITGRHVFNPKENDLTLVKGPLFTTFLLADEINRAPAKTHSALLEAMQERQVTVGRQTYALSPNFTVFATQNPVELEGMYPLAESQKDRFMLKIAMGCPTKAEELQLGERTLTKEAPEMLLESGAIRPILTTERLAVMRQAMDTISVSAEMVRYVVAITRRTREHTNIRIGAGPRATQSLLLSSRVHAALQGRNSVTPEDVKRMAPGCLEHRLILWPEFEQEGLTCTEVVQHILQSVSVPT